MSMVLVKRLAPFTISFGRSEIFKYRLECLYLLVFQMIFLTSIFDTNITMLYINIKLKVFQGQYRHTYNSVERGNCLA